MTYKAHHDTLDRRTIVDERLPDEFNGFRILFISDIHRRRIRKSTLIKAHSAIDAVVIGGDLTEKWVPVNRTRQNLKVLKNFDAPIYFVWGNNDYDAGQEKISSLLAEENVSILKEAKTTFSRNNSSLTLIGLDYREDEREGTGFALDDNQEGYIILTAHSPSTFDELPETEQHKIHTFLSSHTHGGQIRIFGYGPYQRGGYQVDQTTHRLVSEGYGYRLLPFRIGTKAECHEITFRNNK
ncbi:metallophosphoesterase [Oceanobacillus massiliensis]|nr:metallophosphoesterase [Oceanobacillus massiliensis]